MQEILQTALSNGIFAGLFTFLLFYILKDSKKREDKYNQTIDKLTEHLGTLITDIKEEVGHIKTKIDDIDDKFKNLKKENFDAKENK